MEPRINFLKVDRGAFEAMLGIENYLRECGIESKLLDLMRLRASQINGCAVWTWQESPYYSDRERAALAWTEAVKCPGRARARSIVSLTDRGVTSEHKLTISSANSTEIGYATE